MNFQGYIITFIVLVLVLFFNLSTLFVLVFWNRMFYTFFVPKILRCSFIPVRICKGCWISINFNWSIAYTSSLPGHFSTLNQFSSCFLYLCIVQFVIYNNELIIERKLNRLIYLFFCFAEKQNRWSRTTILKSSRTCSRRSERSSTLRYDLRNSKYL